jgi:predicted ATP-dependent endonuclease of OLD family
VDTRTVVLVEGVSDQHAVEALARRRGRDLGAEGVSVVPMGGATNIARFLERFGPRGLGVRLAGLCDVREEDAFRRGLRRAGLGSDLTRAGMEALGFYVCVVDLEDELIRSLGPAAMERIIETLGELTPWRTFQKQPAQRERPIDQQLRRFLGTHKGRKIRYAPVLVDALDLTQIPRPLDGLLTHV